MQPTLPIKVVQYLISTTKNHKKKIIAIILIILSYKWARKKLTFQHIIYVVQKLSYLFSLLSYLPLPESPIYRQVAVYQHFIPLKSLPIPTLMEVQKISRKIKQKQQGSWNQLKVSVFAGIIMSLTLYDLRSFFKTVEYKYLQDFKTIRSQKYFIRFIKELKKKFIDSLQITFQIIKQQLQVQIAQISLKQKLNFEQIQKTLKDMVNKIFQSKYNFYDQNHDKLWKQDLTDQISNLFYSPFRMKKKQSQSITSFKNNPIVKLGSKLFSITKTIVSLPFNINQLFPSIKQQMTSQRFSCCKNFYGLPIKKVNDFDFQNQQEQLDDMKDNQTQMLMNQRPMVPRKASLQSQISEKPKQQQIKNTTQMSEANDKQAYKFCKMILSQIQETVQSINFHTLIYHHAYHKLEIFLNRIKMYMLKMRLNNIMIADFLPVGYKIIKQQILTTKQKRDNFYEGQILKSLRVVRTQEQNNNNNASLMTSASYNHPQPQDQSALEMRNFILQQIYNNHEFGYLEREFQLKYFHERNKIVVTPSKSKKTREEDDDVQQTLNMLVNQN